jgi:hypothetical protein
MEFYSSKALVNGEYPYLITNETISVIPRADAQYKIP